MHINGSFTWVVVVNVAALELDRRNEIGTLNG